MPIFLLIRHGETDYNRRMRIPGQLPDVHLTLRGQQQAQDLANNLATAPVRAIYSSPLERAMETAGPLAKALGLEITPRPDLLETNCGEWQGQSVKKLRRLKIWKSAQQQPDLFRFPGGESIFECQQRMVQALESIRLQYTAQDLVACFSHADPLKLVIAYFMGLPLDHFQRLAVDLASITVMQITESGSRLIGLNYPPSLFWDSFLPATQPK
jgi:probable phosphoglycerate mutase